MTGTAIAISDADEAEALSEYLTSPDRQHPAVVVTRRFGKPLFDAKSLASDLHDVAAVFDLVTPKATWGLSVALTEGAAMMRTQFDSMQELVEFITDDDGHIDESAADEVFQYLTQLQGEARHLREGLKVSNDRLESMKQKMMQKQRENSYSDGRQLQVAAVAVRRQGGGQAVRARADGHAGPPRMGHAVRSGREEKPCAAEDMGVFRLVLRHAGIHTHQRQQGGGRDGRGADRA